MSQADALVDHVIRPVAEALGGLHPVLEEVLLSAATLRQFDPFRTSADQGLGLFGISTALHWRVWDNYLAWQPEKASCVRGFASQHQFLMNPDAELITNARYSAAIGISALEWVRSDWPPATDSFGLSRLWSRLTQCQEDQYLAGLQRTLDNLLISGRPQCAV